MERFPRFGQQLNSIRSEVEKVLEPTRKKGEMEGRRLAADSILRNLPTPATLAYGEIQLILGSDQLNKVDLERLTRASDHLDRLFTIMYNLTNSLNDPEAPITQNEGKNVIDVRETPVAESETNP